MKRFLTVLVTLACLSAFAQDAYKGTDFGFRLSTNVTAKTYEWTNNNAYPFRLLNISFNSDASVTTIVTLVRPHSITRQYFPGTVSTNEMGGVETNYTTVVTNTVTSYATNVLLSVTNTATIYDEDDFPSVYIQRNDVLRFNFGATNTIGILLDAMR